MDFSMNPDTPPSVILESVELVPTPTVLVPAPLAPPPAPAGKPTRHGPTNPQYFLGLFILWQLFFLFICNFVAVTSSVRDRADTNLSPDWKARINWLAPGWLEKEGHVHDALRVLDDVTTRWEQLAAQPQSWSLFAPTMTKEITFLAVELRWDNPKAARNRRAQAQVPFAPQLLLSDNEPRDPTHFFRWGQFRLRKYEGSLDVVLRVWTEDKETLADAVRRWQGVIRDKVKQEWSTIPAYLKMRCRDFMAQHPERPQPRQVILLVRRFSIPEPGKFSEEWYRDPGTRPQDRNMPLARWQPGVVRKDGYEIEWFRPRLDGDNNLTGDFESLAD
jgi:hypothetical protein